MIEKQFHGYADYSSLAAAVPSQFLIRVAVSESMNYDLS